VNILYVEDDRDILENISEILEDLCDRLITASNGKEALELFNHHGDIDLIITDINMPEMNGLELISEIKNIDENIPILITSANSDHDHLIKALN
jgi:CheY-like chemotaxis protein